MSDVLFTDGHAGRLAVHRWDPAEPQRIVVLAHGYGEHAGRYEHVADRLTADGALVVAPDHAGHGRSDGERALIEDLERLVDDLAAVGAAVLAERPGLPVALVGHSLGAIVATRLAQRGDLPVLWLHGEEDALAPLVHAEPAVAGLGAASVERHVYPGAQHEVLNETHRDEVIAVLVDFVRRTTA